MGAIAEKIQAAQDIREFVLDIPEWGVSLLVIEPMMNEGETWKKKHTKTRLVKGTLVTDTDMTAVAWEMFYNVLRDPETKEKIFDDPAHVAKVLGSKSQTVMTKLMLACREFLLTEVSEAAVEEAEGK